MKLLFKCSYYLIAKIQNVGAISTEIKNTIFLLDTVFLKSKQIIQFSQHPAGFIQLPFPPTASCSFIVCVANGVTRLNIWQAAYLERGLKDVSSDRSSTLRS